MADFDEDMFSDAEPTEEAYTTAEEYPENEYSKVSDESFSDTPEETFEEENVYVPVDPTEDDEFDAADEPFVELYDPAEEGNITSNEYADEVVDDSAADVDPTDINLMIAFGLDSEEG